MSTAIQRIKDRLTKANIQRNTESSRQWLYRNARRIVTSASISQLRSESRLVSRPVPGHMYMYLYDPKGKDTLEFYDRFPLVFVVKYYKDGFLGLNLHYLQPIYRMRLFEMLLTFQSDTRYNEKTRLEITYRKLMAVSRSDFAKPCLKRYLYSQLDTKFIQVPADEWELALFIPFERFKHKNRAYDKRDVWANSASLL